ncbi:MAG: FMN-binding protein [Candidatus Dormibacteraeota bacterium]|nr:FMN-binding protein [Candidatus Dormibacteraeota bacterium]
MKRAVTAFVATVVGLFWVLTFKVTPHQAAGVAATSPPPSASGGQPVSASPTPTSSTAPASTPSPTPVKKGADGTFTGTDVPTIYGDVQVRIVVSGGRLSDVKALQLPSDRARSAEISQYAGPALRSEAIQAQSANVDIVSGATYTSEAYAESLNGALQQAHLG